MTRATNARLAGSTYLFYIAVAFPGMMLFARAANADGIGAKLASIGQHAADVRVTIVLSLLSCFSALVLAVTLYAVTRDEDEDLAMLALTCRVGEGVIGAISILAKLGLLWLATANAGSGAADATGAFALGKFLLKMHSWSIAISATFFAVGSMLFCYLFLRGRMIPVSLAWLGVVASIVIVVALPLQLTGLLTGPVTSYIWLPMLVFEPALGLWLIIKGAVMPMTHGERQNDKAHR